MRTGGFDGARRTGRRARDVAGRSSAAIYGSTHQPSTTSPQANTTTAGATHQVSTTSRQANTTTASTTHQASTTSPQVNTTASGTTHQVSTTGAAAGQQVSPAGQVSTVGQGGAVGQGGTIGPGGTISDPAAGTADAVPLRRLAGLLQIAVFVAIGAYGWRYGIDFLERSSSWVRTCLGDRVDVYCLTADAVWRFTLFPVLSVIAALSLLQGASVERDRRPALAVGLNLAALAALAASLIWALS